MRSILLIPFCLLGVSFTAGAAELEVRPGLWETTMTQTNPMTGEMTQSSQTCVEETTFDPESLMSGTGTEHCTVRQNSLSGNTLNFAMSCTMHGSTANVMGNYTVSNDEGTGKMTMDMSAGGMSFKMNMNWTSRRVGDC